MRFGLEDEHSPAALSIIADRHFKVLRERASNRITIASKPERITGSPVQSAKAATRCMAEAPQSR